MLVPGNVSGLSGISKMWALNTSNYGAYKRSGFENELRLIFTQVL